MYHEKQRKQLCALHALNNLFQDANAFTQKDLDAICKSISPDTWFMNPHKSALGLGNYDINVIMKALQPKGFEAVWFDKRRDPKSELNLKVIRGIYIKRSNPQLSSRSQQWIYGLVSLPLNFIVSRRHWIAVIRSPTDGRFYDLDSKLSEPQLIGDEEELMQYLISKNKTSGCEIFVVIPRLVAEDGSWKGPHSP